MRFTNASEILQRVMLGILSGIDRVRWAHDDVVVYACDTKQHHERLDACLQRLCEFGITLNREKCRFARPTVEFLGMRLTARGMQPAAEKIDAMQNFRQPATVADVRSFLGTANFLAKFIPSFVDLAAPLRQLTKKGQAWEWTAKHTAAAFNSIKKAIADADTLAFFDRRRHTELLVDASPIGLGAILTQWKPDP